MDLRLVLQPSQLLLSVIVACQQALRLPPNRELARRILGKKIRVLPTEV